MSHRSKKRGPTRKRRARSTPRPRPTESRPESEAVVFETSIGSFVCYEDDTPYVQYHIFRPDHDQVLEEITERKRAGEKLTYEESWQRITRFGVLMVAADEYGVTAELYLDRKLVKEEEVETLTQGTFELLDQIPLGPDGGSFSVYWMDEITDYSFGDV
jgi:hypothetical protein